MKLTLPPSFLTWANFPNLMKQLGESSLETQTNTNTKKKIKFTHARNSIWSSWERRKSPKMFAHDFVMTFPRTTRSARGQENGPDKRKRSPGGGERGESLEREPPTNSATTNRRDRREKTDWVRVVAALVCGPRMVGKISAKWVCFCLVRTWERERTMCERGKIVRKSGCCCFVNLTWIFRSRVEGKVW